MAEQKKKSCALHNCRKQLAGCTVGVPGYVPFRRLSVLSVPFEHREKEGSPSLCVQLNVSVLPVAVLSVYLPMHMHPCTHLNTRKQVLQERPEAPLNTFIEQTRSGFFATALSPSFIVFFIFYAIYDGLDCQFIRTYQIRYTFQYFEFKGSR